MSETKLVFGRSCGGCTACCKTHTVATIKSWTGTWCRFCEVSGEHAGCRIYETRPPTCHEYHCWWLQGFGSDNQRPDLIGIVPDGATVLFDGEAIQVINLWEVERGKCDEDFVIRFTEKQTNLGYVICHRLMFLPRTIQVRYYFPPRFTAPMRERFIETANEQIM